MLLKVEIKSESHYHGFIQQLVHSYVCNAVSYMHS